MVQERAIENTLEEKGQEENAKTSFKEEESEENPKAFFKEKEIKEVRRLFEKRGNRYVQLMFCLILCTFSAYLLYQKKTVFLKILTMG